MYYKASELYSDLPGTYFDEYYDLSDAKRNKMDPKYGPPNLTLDELDYSEWYNEKSGDEEELGDLSTVENDEEKYPITPLSKDDKKERKRLAQRKARNKSNKLENKVREILYILCQHYKITNKVYNNLMKSS